MKAPQKEKQPFPFPVIGLFVIMGLCIYVSDLWKENAVASNPAYVDGVVMCEYPNHYKGMDFMCFQYRVAEKLYIGRVGVKGVVEHAFDGQKCRVVYEKDNPKNSKVISLNPQSGEVVSASDLGAEVIFVDGECTCD